MIVVFGAEGQLGRALGAVLGARALLLPRAQVELTQPQSILENMKNIKPSVVINAAAYTKVDLAETERDVAFAVNAEAPAAMARWCADAGVLLAHVSTDYVFDGSGNAPWKETDAPRPLNVYGESKLKGERAVAESGCRHFIFRTSWVYDAHGSNFVSTMLRLGAEREVLRVVSDQVGAPTYAPHLAAGITQAVEKADAPSGVYHLCNGGQVSWHGFAQAIFGEARLRGERLAVKEVQAIPSADYPTPATRPLNSRLDCSKARVLLGVALPAWQEGLSACMDERYADYGRSASGA